MKNSVCELCNGEASLYCGSDSAFLCWNCDARVHEANFLVARHVRLCVCLKCKGFNGNCISGVGIRPVQSICRSCLPESGGGAGDVDSDSSSSTCISSAESLAFTPKKSIDLNRKPCEKIACSSSITELRKKKKNVERSRVRNLRSRTPAKDILVIWCRKLGLKSIHSVSVASDALKVCLQQMTVLPFRVSLASSLWFSLKLSKGRSSSTCHDLKRLELISGIPAKLIVLAELKLSRILQKSCPHKEEEGWAECSD